VGLGRAGVIIIIKTSLFNEDSLLKTYQIQTYSACNIYIQQGLQQRNGRVNNYTEAVSEDPISIPLFKSALLII